MATFLSRSDIRIHDEPLPLFVYSFSSKGFVDLRDIVIANIERIPDSYLWSLYDYKYILSESNLTGSQETRVRIWDSGGYETSEDDDLSSHFSAIAGNEIWEEETYVETACSIPWNSRDILVNFDCHKNRSAKCISQQIEEACGLFERIPGTYLRDILLHVERDVDITSMVKEIKKYEGCFDILGFTEKEVAYTWHKGIHFLNEMRNCLAAEFSEYIPIHLFGCFDPKSIIFFCLSGADIFDGLSWLRYFVRGRQTLYTREYEAFIPLSLQSELDFYRPEIMANNIVEFSRLRNDLSYAILTDEFGEFRSEIKHIESILDR